MCIKSIKTSFLESTRTKIMKTKGENPLVLRCEQEEEELEEGKVQQKRGKWERKGL